MRMGRLNKAKIKFYHIIVAKFSVLYYNSTILRLGEIVLRAENAADMALAALIDSE